MSTLATLAVTAGGVMVIVELRRIAEAILRLNANVRILAAVAEHQAHHLDRELTALDRADTTP